MKKYILWLTIFGVLLLSGCLWPDRQKLLDDAVSFCVWNGWTLTTSWDVFVCTFSDWTSCESPTFGNWCIVPGKDVESNLEDENNQDKIDEPAIDGNETINHETINHDRDIINTDKTTNQEVVDQKNLWTNSTHTTWKDTEEIRSCTADVKECPDGSFVSRIPPNCDFQACPEIKKSEVNEISQNIDSDDNAWQWDNQKWFTDIIREISWHTGSANSEETADLSIEIIDFIKNME
jgi:hypothetical protein